MSYGQLTEEEVQLAARTAQHSAYGYGQEITSKVNNTPDDIDLETTLRQADNQSLGEIKNTNYIPSNIGHARVQNSTVTDSNWVRASLLNLRKAPPSLMRSRHSTARYSFTDTSLGGDFAINTPYQYTCFADLKARTAANVGYGKGRFYHEQIWENRHDIHIKFGFQAFTSPFTFFSRWYNYPQDRMARTGRGPTWLYSAGQLAGTWLAWTMPVYPITMSMIKVAMGLLGESRYYYVKDGMYAYWGAVNNLVAALAANMSLTMPVQDESYFQRAELAKAGIGATSGIFNEVRNNMNEFAGELPDIYRVASDGGFNIDMFAVSTRATRLQNRFDERMRERIEQRVQEVGRNENISEYLEQYADDEFNHVIDIERKAKYTFGNNDGSANFFEYMSAFINSDIGSDTINQNGNSNTLGEQEENQKLSSVSIQPAESIQSYWGNTKGNENDKIPTNAELIKAQQMMGASYITFRVNGTKSVSESFSNSAEESELAGAFNNFAKARQKFNFNFAGGQMLGDTVKGVMNAALDGVMGVLSGLGLEGLGGVITGAMIDIPKTWSSGSVSLPRLSYDIQLRTPYGHPLAIFQDLMVPTLCLIGGTAQISRGKAAFGSPFYCQVWDKGRWQVMLGCIESLNITRGVGNVPWTRHGQPLGIDLSFSILDMSNVITVPITGVQGVSDVIDQVAGGKIIETLTAGSDTTLDDYLFSLASLGLTEQIYKTNRIQRNFHTLTRKWQSAFSSDAWISWAMNETPLTLFQLIAPSTTRDTGYTNISR